MNDDTKELLDRYNAKDRAIVDIWNDIGHVCPFIVRAYDAADDAAVMVTQVCKGTAYGFPMFKGKRTSNDWYYDTDTQGVRIPDAGTTIWQLVDVPYDDLDKVMFRLDLHGECGAEDQEPEMNTKAVITFGKYRDRTIGEIIDRDPGYISWALANSTIFNKIAFSL